MPVVHPIQDAQKHRTKPKARVRRPSVNVRVGVGAASPCQPLKPRHKSQPLQIRATTNSGLPGKSQIAAGVRVKKQSRQLGAQTPPAAEVSVKTSHNAVRAENPHVPVQNKRKGTNGQTPRASNGVQHDKGDAPFTQLWISAPTIAGCW